MNIEKEINQFYNWLSFKPNLTNKDIQNKNYKITKNDKTQYLISLKKYQKMNLKDIIEIKKILKDI